VARVSLVIFPVIAVTLTAMGHWGYLVWAFFPIFQLLLTPNDHRRQILGRPVDQ
jgi:nitrate reductase NapE component